ncbi:hypothetical protein [Anabaena sp. CCY 9910]|uniref:hypothetical protein n=1 Tax=Anabaena sp. CCY 9910 TaxID=3103870 RepID=UPI0039DF9327
MPIVQRSATFGSTINNVASNERRSSTRRSYALRLGVETGFRGVNAQPKVSPFIG